MTALVEVLGARLARVGASVPGLFTTAPDLAAVPLERLAERAAAHAGRYVDALVEKRLRKAVLARDVLGASWPLGALVAPGAIDDVDRALGTFGNVDALAWRWPLEVAPLDVANALAASRDADAQAVAKLITAGRFRTCDVDDPGDGLGAGPDGTQWSFTGLDAATVPKVHRWSPRAVAAVVAAEKAVRRDARRRAVPLPATRHGRAALAMVSQGDLERAWNFDSAEVVGSSVELVWGRADQPSFKFALTPGRALAEQDLSEQVVRGILTELEPDGLRDYVLLHRMAAARDRTGLFQWTWREHRERSAYARRIAMGNVSDREAAEQVTRRLWQLKRAEVHQSIERADGSRVWRRVGPFGLIDIAGGVTLPDGHSFELAWLRLNPELYAGASRMAKQPCFALLPDEALALDGPRLRLATMLSLAMRYARDQGGSVVRTAQTLWTDLNAYGGEPAPRDWSRAGTFLHATLDELVAAGVLGAWTREGGILAPARPTTRYMLEPPAWWVDRLVHSVPAELPPSTVELPRNGGELVAWREAHRWSQAELAAHLRVGRATIQRAERATTKPLGNALDVAIRQTPTASSGG